MKVIVEQYSHKWATDFERLSAELRPVLSSVPEVRVEHVGSTSVPGLAAKPILDIDIIVEPNHLQDALRLMEQAGYRSNGEQGIEGRLALEAPDRTPARHVYLCRADSLAVKNHLVVRDALRSSKELRDEYGALKLELAQRDFESMDDYVFAKTELLQKILALSGLSAAELAQIKAANS